MARLNNLGRFPKKFIDDPQFKSLAQTLRLGRLAGSEKIYINIDRMKPRGRSAKYHNHSRQEEFFLILAGSGTLRLNNRTYKIRKGDFFAKPAGRGMAHQFINTGGRVLEILDCGLTDRDDVAGYPDEGVILLRKKGLSFKTDDALKNWHSNPNPITSHPEKRRKRN